MSQIGQQAIRNIDGGGGKALGAEPLALREARREMMIPRVIEGLDPREVVNAQARTLYFLDTVTQLDELMLDIAPDAKGAAVQAIVRLKTKPPPEKK